MSERRRQRVDEEKARAAWVRWMAGERVVALAAEIGVSESGLRNFWVRVGLLVPAGYRHLTVTEVKVAAAAVESGRASTAEIARELGRNAAHLREVLRHRGVVREVTAPRPKRADRDRRVLGWLLSGRAWLWILAELEEDGPAHLARTRLCNGVQRYCARERIPVPAAALAPLREGLRSGPPKVTVAQAAAALARVRGGERTADVAAELGMSYDGLRKRWRALGLDPAAGRGSDDDA